MLLLQYAHHRMSEGEEEGGSTSIEQHIAGRRVRLNPDSVFPDLGIGFLATLTFRFEMFSKNVLKRQRFSQPHFNLTWFVL